MRALLIGVVVIASGCRGGPPRPAPVPAVANRVVPAADADAEPEPTDERATDAVVIGAAMPPIPPRACLGSSLRREDIDLDKDGKTDVRKLWITDAARTDWRVCELIDFTADGQFDLARVYDPNGTVLAELMDLDYDGRVDLASTTDAVSHVTIVVRDTDGNGAADTVEAPTPGATTIPPTPGRPATP